jgi:hypothetical protein
MESMNLAEFHKKLIAAAKANPPSDNVPFAFEKRIVALLARPAMDYTALWARALWRGALGCMVIVFVVGALSVLAPNRKTDNLAQDFESTMLASADQDTDSSAW